MVLLLGADSHPRPTRSATTKVARGWESVPIALDIKTQHCPAHVDMESHREYWPYR